MTTRRGRKSLSGHQSAAMGSDTWLTPPEWIERLGSFDLDPCTPPAMPWSTAASRYTETEDGLAQPWCGRVWLNPPFGNKVARWLSRLVQHGDGIALVAARTETKWFFRYVWDAATAVLFVRGRPHFHFADGTRAPFNSGAPICLVAYGESNAQALRSSELGRYVRLR